MALSVVDRHELHDLLTGGTPVVADFYADWCAPCHALSPELESLQARLGDTVRFVKVDVDANPELATELGVMSIPTVIHFSADGKEAARTVGAQRADRLARSLGLKVD
ncbi:MAG: thioredoxin family protein [Candidatus Binatia bacterium]